MHEQKACLAASCPVDQARHCCCYGQGPHQQPYYQYATIYTVPIAIASGIQPDSKPASMLNQSRPLYSKERSAICYVDVRARACVSIASLRYLMGLSGEVGLLMYTSQAQTLTQSIKVSFQRKSGEGCPLCHQKLSCKSCLMRRIDQQALCGAADELITVTRFVHVCYTNVALMLCPSKYNTGLARFPSHTLQHHRLLSAVASLCNYRMRRSAAATVATHVHHHIARPFKAPL